MISKQNNTGDDAKKQQPASSTSIKIYDEGIDPNKKQEPPRRANRTNALANANNKFEPNQEEEEVPQQFSKKKKRFQQKKKFSNKNRNDWNKNRNKNAHRNGAMNNSDHSRNSGFNENYHHGMRSNNQDYRAYEQAKMVANHDPAGLQPPFPRYIPGNQHTFPIPHPQHSIHHHRQQHLFAHDGNAKILLESDGNGNGFRASDSQYVSKNNNNGNGNGNVNENNVEPNVDSASCKWWVGMIDHNVQVDAVVLTIGGNIHHVPVPPQVGAYLKHELLVQKENFINAKNFDNVGSEANEILRGDAQQANASAQGLGEHGNAISSSSTGTWNHDSPQFVDRRWAYPMATNPDHPHTHFYPHPYINGHPEGQIPYGIPVNQHQQPFNGGAPFPPPNSNGSMRMTAPTSNYPMMLQQVQYAPMYNPQYLARAPEANMYQGNGSNIPGYDRPNDLHANADHTGLAGNTNGENPVNAQGSSVDRQQANNGRSNMEATPNRGGANDGIVAEGGNHARNQIALTPHRGAPGVNGDSDARRVSFSPKVPSFQTPATVNGDNI